MSGRDSPLREYLFARFTSNRGVSPEGRAKMAQRISARISVTSSCRGSALYELMPSMMAWRI